MQKIESNDHFRGKDKNNENINSEEYTDIERMTVIDEIIEDEHSNRSGVCFLYEIYYNNLLH